MSFKLLWLTLSSNSIGVVTLSLLLKLAPKRLEPWFALWKFLSPEAALYHCKSTICPCMEYCCHIWAPSCSPSCYWELLDKLQKQICRTVGPCLAFSHEPLAHCQNVASLKSYSNLSKKKLLFASMIALQNWWKMLFNSS